MYMYTDIYIYVCILYIYIYMCMWVIADSITAVNTSIFSTHVVENCMHVQE